MVNIVSYNFVQFQKMSIQSKNVQKILFLDLM